MRYGTQKGYSGGLPRFDVLVRKFALVTVAAITVMFVAVQAAAQGAGAWRPEGPWNGMQIKYSISGATISSTEEGGPFCCWIRTLKGDLPASGTLRVSGSVGMVSGLYANASVRVSAGNASKEWSGVVDSQKNQWAPFDVSVVIPPGATSGSISISMTGTYGSAAAGESRGISIGASFSRSGPAPPVVVATPKPTPRPVPTARPTPASNLDEAADAIDDFIDKFKDTCFGNTPGFSLGDKGKFRRNVKTDLVIEDDTAEAKAFLAKRKKANASTYDSKTRLGEPLPTTMVLPFKIPKSTAAKKADDANRETLWHETVHHIEILHGDRDQPDNWHAAFRERNGAYLDAVINNLNDLANVESKLPRQAGESDEDWAQRKESMLGSLETMGDQFKDLEAGAETAKVGLEFESGDTKKRWPPDLKQLKAWTGIKVSWNDILNHYASGECGEDLKNFALKQLAASGQPIPITGQAPVQFSIDDGSPPPAAEERVLFSTSNDYALGNRSLSPIFRLDTTSTITSIITHHLEIPGGTKPGTIGMVDEDEIYYGPWQVASANSGVWEIKPNIVLKPGRYKILDSQPSTWAQNPQNAGFAVVKGFPGGIYKP